MAFKDLKAPLGNHLIFMAQVVGITLTLLGNLKLGISVQVLLFLSALTSLVMASLNSATWSPDRASLKLG
eukprot:3602015-Ditylum_brightwellii.AAC.1